MSTLVAPVIDREHDQARHLDQPQNTSRDTVKVLHVVNGEHFSGAERVQDLLGQYLPQYGYEAGFATLLPGRFAAHRQAHETPLYEFKMRRRWDIQPARDIAQIVQDEGYKVLHAHTPRSLLIAALAARRTGLPLVYHVHSPASRDSTRRLINWLNDRLERWCAKHAKRVITVSPSLTEHMLSHGFSPDQLQCIFNGVPSLDHDSPRR